MLNTEINIQGCFGTDRNVSVEPKVYVFDFLKKILRRFYLDRNLVQMLVFLHNLPFEKFGYLHLHWFCGKLCLHESRKVIKKNESLLRTFTKRADRSYIRFPNQLRQMFWNQRQKFALQSFWNAELSVQLHRSPTGQSSISTWSHRPSKLRADTRIKESHQSQ